VITNFCAIPELFVIPAPVMFNRKAGTVMVKRFAPALNTMLLTSAPSEMETPVVLEESNVAVSAGPLGGPPAVR